jgi:hypothetical protein
MVFQTYLLANWQVNSGLLWVISTHDARVALFEANQTVWPGPSSWNYCCHATWCMCSDVSSLPPSRKEFTWWLGKCSAWVKGSFNVCTISSLFLRLISYWMQILICAVHWNWRQFSTCLAQCFFRCYRSWTQPWLCIFHGGNSVQIFLEFTWMNSSRGKLKLLNKDGY